VLSLSRLRLESCFGGELRRLGFALLGVQLLVSSMLRQFGLVRRSRFGVEQRSVLGFIVGAEHDHAPGDEAARIARLQTWLQIVTPPHRDRFAAPITPARAPSCATSSGTGR
jgi:hypothetical protein